MVLISQTIFKKANICKLQAEYFCILYPNVKQLMCLTQFRLSKLPHKNQILILGISGYKIKIFLEKKWLNYLNTVETLIRCIWSGSALFANYPFGGLPTKMG